MEKYRKPVIGVYLQMAAKTRAVIEIKKQKYKAVVYPNPEKAVEALAKMCQYSRWLVGHQQ
jgi:hypothetical protein